MSVLVSSLIAAGTKISAARKLACRHLPVATFDKIAGENPALVIRDDVSAELFAEIVKAIAHRDLMSAAEAMLERHEYQHLAQDWQEAHANAF